MKKRPEIKASFRLVGSPGEDIDLSEITEAIAILPTMTRTLDDWPDDGIAHGAELPEDMLSRCVWEIELERECCMMTNQRLEPLIQILQDKVDAIRSLKERYRMSAHFLHTAYVYRLDEPLPLLELTSDAAVFLAAVGADISFEMRFK